ncbi:MAG: hypothetical protein LC797_13230 [Chloroflexi bacterium]|nr:hypothetical protein [Chloroflexota bacterium]
MPLLPGFSLVFILALLLIGTTPGRTSPGPALGAGAGANQGFAGLGISPIMPMHVLGPVSEPRRPRLMVALQPPAGCPQDTPADPPPTSAA